MLKDDLVTAFLIWMRTMLVWRFLIYWGTEINFHFNMHYTSSSNILQSKNCNIFEVVVPEV